jgi:hypothetical protein
MQSEESLTLNEDEDSGKTKKQNTNQRREKSS